MNKPELTDFICLNKTRVCDVLENEHVGHKDCGACDDFQFSPDYTPVDVSTTPGIINYMRRRSYRG